MEVLKSCKLAMRLGNLSRKNGCHLWKWRIPNYIIDLILLLPMTICSVQMVIFCCNNANTLKTISNATYLWYGIISMLKDDQIIDRTIEFIYSLGIGSISAMYVCLAANNNLIISTLDHLQAMIALSK